MRETRVSFKTQEYRRQGNFRRTSPTISARGRMPIDERGRQYDYMLALGHEDENLYPTLRGPEGVRRFFDERNVTWWRHDEFDAPGVNGPTRNMASSQVSCLNFVLPLAGIEKGLQALLAAIDDDVTDVVTIEDPTTAAASRVEFEWIGLGHALEGESETRRGEFSTSVDAFLVAQTRTGRRAYLLEWKYTEFYGNNDMGRGRKGWTRRSRYGKPYAVSPSFREQVPLDAWLHEPFYQIMRQRLLADRIVARRELGVCEAKVVLVVPNGNLEYSRSLTSPTLLAAFPDAQSVEDVTRAAMNVPDRDFAVVSQHTIGEVVRARCGGAVRHWSEYHRERYGW
ncbi:MAG: hypothetical protein OXQ84_01780 [bacterium]|nr:hypothetical protein [bacterium]